MQQEAFMRNVFILVILTAMLIGVFLVAKNMRTKNVDGVTKMETIQKAKDTADIVDNAVKKMKKAME
jgi:hypothetical protein